MFLLELQKFQSYQSKQINPDLISLETSLYCPVTFQSYQSKQINPDPKIGLSVGTNASLFQSYQSKQINPDFTYDSSTETLSVSFNRINPNRSIPTHESQWINQIWKIRRFNRINPNRSIPTQRCGKSPQTIIWGFNRINPNRSIPTIRVPQDVSELEMRFQSYQSKQINPDHIMGSATVNFSAYVSIVSIQTDQSRQWQAIFKKRWRYLVSIVSIQTDQSRPVRSFSKRKIQRALVSIVSIQTDQSRLWWWCQVWSTTFQRFQSYQSKQINPDDN